MKLESLFTANDEMRKRRWLEEIRADYEKAARLIRESPEDAVIDNSALHIKTARREVTIELNCHRPIKCGGLLPAFEAAAASIKAEIEEIDEKIAALE